MSNKNLIVGCGYVGARLADTLRTSGEDVFAVVRSEQSCAKLASLGVPAVAIDLDSVTADSWSLSPEVVDGSHLYYFTPPQNALPQNERELSDFRIDRFLRRVKGRPSLFVYMSTTGVYGNQAGAEVDESTPVDPQTDRAHRRMSAEHMTRVWCNERQIRRVVLRVPGIYGPGRLALSRLQRGEPFVRVAEAGISNRIHVDDLVSICLAVARNAESRGVYNVSDGSSMSSTEFMQHVATIAQLPPPKEVSLEQARREFSAERMSFLSESRRVSNRRLLNELGLALRFADIDAGIRASL